MLTSLRIKIWTAVNSSILLFAVLFYVLLPKIVALKLAKDTEREVEYISRTIANGISIALADENFTGIQSSMEYARSDNRLAYVLMFSNEKNSKGLDSIILFRTYPEALSLQVSAEDKSIDTLVVKGTDFSSHVMTGRIVVAYSTEQIDSFVDDVKSIVFLISLVIIIVTSILSYWVAIKMTKPIIHLSNAAQEVSEGNYTMRVQVNSKDELNDLATSFNNMLSEIEKGRSFLVKKNDELAAKNDQLKELNEVKNNLVGMVSHDLKSPLNQMKSLIYLLRAKSIALPESIDELLLIMESSIKNGLAMITRMLSREVIAAGQRKVAVEVINVTQLFMESANHFIGIAEEKKISFEFTGFTTVHKINSDRGYLMQIFQNLISNAVKYSPPDSKVYLAITRNGHLLELSVRDEGLGVKPEDVGKLFTKFQSEEASAMVGEDSTGIGLTIVKNYANAIGATIWYDEKNQKGAKFVISLSLLD